MPLTIVTAHPGARLADLSIADVQAAFREHGLVVLRGFPTTPSEFEALTRPFTRDYFFGYGRAPFVDQPAITTVNESQLALEPHCDNGIRPEPMRPQITWFWCERPAQTGGETTFFDGITVWQRLSAATRALFERHEISYISMVAEPAWRAMGHSDVDAFLRFVATIGARALRVDGGDAVDVEVRSPAVHEPHWSNERAFVASFLVAGSPGFAAMRVALDDGTPIPDAVHADVRSALASCVVELRWQRGDIAMLDNTRFVHGRRAFFDPDRRVYLIQTLHASF